MHEREEVMGEKRVMERFIGEELRRGSQGGG